MWIDINKEHPRIGEPIWMLTNLKERVQSGHRLEDKGMKNKPWFHTDTAIWCGTETVTHWMPKGSWTPKAPTRTKAKRGVGWS